MISKLDQKYSQNSGYMSRTWKHKKTGNWRCQWLNKRDFSDFDHDYMCQTSRYEYFGGCSTTAETTSGSTAVSKRTETWGCSDTDSPTLYSWRLKNVALADESGFLLRMQLIVNCMNLESQPASCQQSMLMLVIRRLAACMCLLIILQKWSDAFVMEIFMV